MTTPHRWIAQRLVGYTYPEGRYLGSIPAPTSISAQLPQQALSSNKIVYAASATRSDLLDTHGLVHALELAVCTDTDRGEWFEPPGARFFTHEMGFDRTKKTPIYQIDTLGVGDWLMRAETVGRTIGTEDKDGNRAIGTTNAGALMRQLILNAKSRVSSNGKRWFEPLTINFTADRDSAEQPWQLALPITLPPQRYLSDVLAALVKNGLCEYEWRGYELYLTNPGTLGRDLTTGRTPTTIRDAASTESPERVSMAAACTDVDMVGDDRKTWQIPGTDPDAPLGRIVRTVSQGAVSLDSTAKLYADRLLIPGAKPRAQYTRGSTNAAGGPLPFVDIKIGDKVLVQTDHGPEPVDVIGITIRADKNDVAWHYTLGDRIDSLDRQLARRTELAILGAGVAGGDGMPPRPPGASTAIPAKITGIVRNTDTYLDASGRARGTVLLAWPAIIKDVDGNVIEDLKRYEILGRTAGEDTPRLITTVDGTITTVTIEDLDPGARWEYQIRAVSSTGIDGVLSDPVVIDVDDDVEPPLRPTPPILSSIAGTVRIRWDGKGVGPNTGDSLDMPPDLRSVRVRRYGSDPANTPTYLGSIVGITDGDFILDTDVKSGTTYYYDLIAVDRSGNESTASAKASVVGRSVADDPEIVNQLGAELVADSAWIGDLTAVIVTADFFKGRRFELKDGGMFASGPTDTARWELSSAGLLERDAQNRKLASWEPGQGIRLYNTAGQVTTQLSTQDYGLSVRNPANGVLTAATSIIFGGAMNQSGAPADWLEYGLYPGQTSSWIESSKAVDTFTWNHAGSRAKVDFGFEAYSSLGDGSKPAVVMVQMAFRIKRVSDGATVYDSSGNLKGALAPPGIPYANDQDQAYFQGVNFVTFNLAPGTYRFTPIFRVGTNSSGAGVGTTSIRERSVAIAQW